MDPESESVLAESGNQKIPKSLDNPLDNIIYSLADQINPYFYRLHMTPNQITTLSLIFLLMSVGAIVRHKPVLFAFLYLLSYFFDCADGSYARRYKMTSKYGDLYDHGKDILGFIIICYVILIRYRNQFTLVSGLTSVLIFSLFLVQTGCEQRYINDSGSSLNLSKYFCPSQGRKNIRQTMKWTRYFGAGSFTVFFTLLVVWLMYSKHK